MSWAKDDVPKTKLAWANRFWQHFIDNAGVDPNRWADFVKTFIKGGNVTMGEGTLMSSSYINMSPEHYDRFILHGNFRWGENGRDKWNKVAALTKDLRTQYIRANGDDLPPGDQNLGYFKP